jgi:hypothetical protein
MEAVRALAPFVAFLLAPLMIPVVAAIGGAVSDWIGRRR